MSVTRTTIPGVARPIVMTVVPPAPARSRISPAMFAVAVAVAAFLGASIILGIILMALAVYSVPLTICAMAIIAAGSATLGWAAHPGSES